MLTQIDEQLEVINDIPIQMLDDVERAMYKQKLLLEIAHFRQREQLYSEKREELLQLELQYRRNQKHSVRATNATEYRGETQGIVIDGLQARVKEAQRKMDLQ